MVCSINDLLNFFVLLLVFSPGSSLANSTNNNDNNDDNVNLSATKEMCKYCFDIIITELSYPTNNTNTTTKKSNKNLEKTIESISPSIKCPLFITWDKKQTSSSIVTTTTTTTTCTDYHLRGCIGTLSPRTLYTSLYEYAKTSAFQDPRFHPIDLKEVKDLRVSVSLLVNYEDCKDCLDWIVGTHGIIINFDYNRRNYNGEWKFNE